MYLYFNSPAKVKGQGKMILTPLLVFHCLTVFTIEMSLVNLDPSLPLQTGLIVYTKMLGLDFSLGEQQQGRYIISSYSFGKITQTEVVI
jgi:hypothetical protein